jgi:hypothetical protein
VPRAVPLPVRQSLVHRHLQGETLAALATDLHQPLPTVRHLWRRYRDRGEAGLAPEYGRCAHRGPRCARLLYRAALWLRRHHPTWGAGLIRLLLQQRWPERAVPHERPLQRWFQQAELNHPPRRLPPQHRQRGQRAHAVWQIDAKEQVTLADGGHASWLTVVDEASGAILATEVFPLRLWQQVEPAAVQAALQRVFERWGLPERLRVDNGHPWGSHNDLPRELALWLLGLGIGVIWNRPRHPQENGRVERAQGLTTHWAEPHRCAGPVKLQQRLEWASTLQREHYPARQGQSRAAAHPELGYQRRGYTAAQEEQQWQEEPVHRYLAQGVWRRLVDQAGKIYLYNRAYQAGQPRAGQNVNVRFDAATGEWVILTDRGQEIRRYAAEQIRREKIRTLEVSYHKPPRRPRTGVQPHVGVSGG